jgi:hypothetical protein
MVFGDTWHKLSKMPQLQFYTSAISEKTYLRLSGGKMDKFDIYVFNVEP